MSDMYFGTTSRMTWVPCPNSGMTRNRVGWTTNGTYLNGGGYARSSSTKHFEPTLTWSFLRQEQVGEIMAYYYGAYGDDPIQWLDPFAMTTNILPPYLSIPVGAFEDSPSWVKNRRPLKQNTPSNDHGFPTQSAVYTLASGDSFRQYTLPVPEGYTFHLGVFGSATGTAEVLLNETPVSLMSVTSDNRVNESVTDNATITVQGEGSLTLAAMIAQIRPTGASVPPGGFLIGEGHSGCRFKDVPAVVGYSAPSALDYQSLTANMLETAIWE